MSSLLRRLNVISVLVLFTLMNGCASTRVDEHGRTHIVGLVWLSLPAPAGTAEAAQVARTRSIGLTLNRSPDSASLVLGYSDQSLATIFNNSIARLPPIVAIQRERQ